MSVDISEFPEIKQQAAAAAHVVTSRRVAGRSQYLPRGILISVSSGVVAVDDDAMWWARRASQFDFFYLWKIIRTVTLERSKQLCAPI